MAKNKKENDITQCHKCQLIGHTAQNYNLDYRYVKCIETHGSGECKIKKEDAVTKDRIYCANCKNYGYPASHKGCPKLMELHEKLSEEINKARGPKIKGIVHISSKYVP
jgi:hypothetical protein